MVLVLMGVSGTGKTTIGKALAADLERLNELLFPPTASAVVAARPLR